MNRRHLLIALFVIGFPVFALAVNPGWMTDLDAAKAKAAKEKKPLLIEFTGSTWCGPCKALSAEVLSSPQFAEVAKNVVLVALDYPSMSERTPEKIRANPELARLMSLKQEYGVPGFPTMLAFDAEGKQIARIVGYGGDKPAAYIAKLNLPK
jgi:protein disulfide-isomerase